MERNIYTKHKGVKVLTQNGEKYSDKKDKRKIKLSLVNDLNENISGSESKKFFSSDPPEKVYCHSGQAKREPESIK